MGNIATCSCYGRGKDTDDLAPLLGAKINRANDRNNDAIINFMRRDSQLTTNGTGDLTDAAGTIEAAEAVLGDDSNGAAAGDDDAGAQGRPRAASGGGGGGDAEDERARDPVMELGIDLSLPDAMKEQRRQSLTSGSSKDKLNQFDFSDSDNDDNDARGGGGGGHSSVSQQASDAEALARDRLAQEQQQQAQGSNDEEEDERAKAAAAAAKAQQEAEARKVLEALEKHQREQEEQEAAERAAAAKAEEEAARAAEEAERQAAAAREAERLKALKEAEEAAAAAEAKRKQEEERKEAEKKKKEEEEEKERKRKEEEAAAAAKAKEEAAKKKPKFTFSKVTKPKISLVKVSPDDKKKEEEEEEKKRRAAEEQRRQEQAAAEEEARRRKEEEDKALARLAREDSVSLELSDVDDDEQSRVRSVTADSAGPYNPVSGVSAIDDDDEISTRGRVLGTIAGSGSTQQLEQKKEQQLLLWVRKYTIGYQNVQVQDFDRSWRDGMAFLALIHAFYPEYIGPFDKKSPRDAVDNLQTAFKVAEEKLDVYPLLDVDDLDEANETDAELVRSYVESLQRVLDPDSV